MRRGRDGDDPCSLPLSQSPQVCTDGFLVFFAEAIDADGADIAALLLLRACPISLVDSRRCTTHARRTSGIAGALGFAFVLALARFAFALSLALCLTLALALTLPLRQAVGQAGLLGGSSHRLGSGLERSALIATCLDGCERGSGGL